MKNRSLANLQTEVDAAYLYFKLAGSEEDKVLARVYSEMSEIESEQTLTLPKP